MKKQKVQRNEIEAMTVIINIRAMQHKVYGRSFNYDDFNGNTIEELRKLQDNLLVEYNASFPPKVVES